MRDKLIIYIKCVFWLSFAHAIADCLLQPPWIAEFKTIGANNDVNPLFPVFVLIAHGLINGGIFAIVSGTFIIGLLEFMFHSYIDLGSTAGLFGIVVDQFLHGICILLYGVIWTWKVRNETNLLRFKMPPK